MRVKRLAYQTNAQCTNYKALRLLSPGTPFYSMWSLLMGHLHVISRGLRLFKIWQTSCHIWVDGMDQIMHCDWLPEQARWSCLSCLGLPAVFRKKKFPKSQIIKPLLTKLFQSRVTPHMVNNPCIQWNHRPILSTFEWASQTLSLLFNQNSIHIILKVLFYILCVILHLQECLNFLIILAWKYS